MRRQLEMCALAALVATTCGCGIFRKNQPTAQPMYAPSCAPACPTACGAPMGAPMAMSAPMMASPDGAVTYGYDGGMGESLMLGTP
jgi:hypothetical protein